MIHVVEGLEYCQELEELYISNQQINGPLKFDLTSLAVIASSLRLLEADHDKIEDVSPLAYLSKKFAFNFQLIIIYIGSVQTLSLRANNIKDLEVTFSNL